MKVHAAPFVWIFDDGVWVSLSQSELEAADYGLTPEVLAAIEQLQAAMAKIGREMWEWLVAGGVDELDELACGWGQLETIDRLRQTLSRSDWGIEFEIRGDRFAVAWAGESGVSDVAVRLPKLQERVGRAWVLREVEDVARELGETLGRPPFAVEAILRTYDEPLDHEFEIEGRIFRWTKSWGGPGRDDVEEAVGGGS